MMSLFSTTCAFSYSEMDLQYLKIYVKIQRPRYGLEEYWPLLEENRLYIQIEPDIYNILVICN